MPYIEEPLLRHWKPHTGPEDLLTATLSAPTQLGVMNVGICVCVLLATLTSGSLSLPTQQKVSQEAKGWALLSDSFSPRLSLHARRARSAPTADQLVNYSYQEESTDPRSSLTQLLVKLLSRTAPGQKSRSSLTSRASGAGASHRIKDRDYVGWMDFGRRSAEEYEYSS